jgi:hypothetical protein
VVERTQSIQYHLPKPGTTNELVRVCKRICESTLGMGVNTTQYNLKRTVEGIRQQPVAHPPVNKFPQEYKDLAVAHLQQYPTVPSHYCCGDSNRAYLEPGVTSRVFTATLCWNFKLHIQGSKRLQSDGS